MKSMYRNLIAFAMLAITASCGNNEGNMQTMNQMKDSIFAAYPSIAAVTLNVQNDNTLIIAVGSQDLYAADEVQRQQVANEMAAMALRLFGKESKLEHGKIMVTQNEMNQEAEPKDALVSQMDFVSAKRAQ
jgi:hypothetical protein